MRKLRNSWLLSDYLGAKYTSKQWQVMTEAAETFLWWFEIRRHFLESQDIFTKWGHFDKVNIFLKSEDITVKTFFDIFVSKGIF